MTYTPQPLNTSDIQLDEDLQDLIEVIAKNYHELWAKERIAKGWRYGDHRDDRKREHPCLVPYESLPESEKQIDRNTASETLKTILLLGFGIEKRT